MRLRLPASQPRRRAAPRGHLPRALLRLGGGLAVAAAAWLLLGPSLVVHAEVAGPGCGGHLAGVDVAGVSSADQNTAIHVQRTDTIPVDLSGEPGQAGVHVDYTLVGGVAIGRDGSGTQYAARVSDYVNATGLYLVQAHSLPAGTCSAAALVDVEGNPLSTPIGDAALAATAAGGLLVAGSGVAAALQSGSGGPGAGGFSIGGEDREIRRSDLATVAGGGDTAAGSEQLACCGLALPMALLMTALAMTGALPAGPGAAVAPPPARRVRWRPRLSLLGILGGVLGSLGSVVFMELSGTVYPTRRWTIEALVVGLLVGLIVPSLGSAVAARRINRRRAGARLSQPRPAPAPAPATRPGPPPAPPPPPPVQSVPVPSPPAPAASATIVERPPAPIAPPPAAAPPTPSAVTPTATPAARTPSFTLGGGGSAPAASAGGWQPTHRVPGAGLVTRPSPAPDLPPGPHLDPGLEVEVAERRGDWARVVCPDGWSGWVDGRLLEPSAG